MEKSTLLLFISHVITLLAISLYSVAPDPVSNCTIINKSSETFHLQCIPGFDGGMEQMFHVTVTDRATGVTHFNKTTRELDLFIEVRQCKGVAIFLISPSYSSSLRDL